MKKIKLLKTLLTLTLVLTIVGATTEASTFADTDTSVSILTLYDNDNIETK